MRKTKRGTLFLILLLAATIITIVVGNNRFNNHQVDYSLTNETEDSSSPDYFPSDKIYVYSLNGNLDIFIKGSKEDSDRYIGYNIRHLIKDLDQNSPSSNYDVWRLNGTGEYSRNRYDKFKLEQSIVRNGEWEMAIREKGANDFVGGSIHGDEITTSVAFFLNGEEVDTDSRINEEADEFKIVTTSDLYRDNTTTQDLELIGEHEKVYTFNPDGLTLEQKVTFQEEMQTDRSYLTMLPILRTDGENQITDTAYVNDSEQDVSREGFEIEIVEATKATISGKDSGITATVEILDKSKDFPTTFYVTNTSNYNKFYFSYQNEDYNVNAGEVWEQTSHYDIDTLN